MEVNGKSVRLPAKATAVIQAMETRGWKYRARMSGQGALEWLDFYHGEECISAQPGDLGDNWLMETMVKYDPEIRKATVDAAFEAMCNILKCSEGKH